MSARHDQPLVGYVHMVRGDDGHEFLLMSTFDPQRPESKKHFSIVNDRRRAKKRMPFELVRIVPVAVRVLPVEVVG